MPGLLSTLDDAQPDRKVIGGTQNHDSKDLFK